MASLAPGNGWFPHWAHGSGQARHGKAARKQAIRASSSVYESRHLIGSQVTSSATLVSGKETISKIMNRLVNESLMAGRTATGMLAWFEFAEVLALILWLSFLAAIVGGAVAAGVPWTIAAIAVIAIHILAAILIFFFGVRIGRILLISAERRNQVADAGARSGIRFVSREIHQ